jgi:23S rRNA (cytosine1962-C5)-methyltransferase
MHPDSTLPACTLTAKGFHWARSGHPWVYRDDLARQQGEHGDVVEVFHGTQYQGSAFLGTRSKIALRWIERAPGRRRPDAAFWRERLAAALGRRAALVESTNAYRVVNDAADGFPGLVVDRFGDVAVLQVTGAGFERLLPEVTDLVQELLGVASVVARNDAAVREKEGLPREVRVLQGVPPERVWVWEEGPLRRVEYEVNPQGGQKTGAFLDQRENRWAAARLACGRLLDAFAYQGLFSLHAAPAVEEAVAVDTSSPALRSLEAAAARNGITNVRAVEANVFEYLKRAQEEGQTFATIVLDPPAFAKSKKDVPAAVRAYRETNRRAMRLLEPGGVLVTCSCSYNLSEEGFVEVLRQAAAESRTDFHVLERRGQSCDHPVLLCHPESQYLKCLVLRRVR